MEYYDRLEKILTIIGLDSPLARSCVGAVAFSVPILFHPDFAYREVDEGIFIPRNWAITNPSDPDATLFPYWILPLLGAVVLGMVL